jgi:hypothetical protein
MSIQNDIDALLRIQKQKKDKKNELNKLTSEENERIKSIKAYLNETGEPGVRIDSKTVITISNHEKKINKNKRNYEAYVQSLLHSVGVDDTQFVKQLLNKTENVVQQQKLVFKKE